jgi:uncharacterized SAM-binding protein YcdF (DUF218 family)
VTAKHACDAPRGPSRLAGPAVAVLGAAAVLAFLVGAFTPLSPTLFAWWAVPRELGPADAIVVLGGAAAPDGTLLDSSLRRAIEGIRLRQRGLAPILVISGRPREVISRTQLAVDLGVPPDSIVGVSGHQTTRGEATAVRLRLGLVRRRVILVSDSQHLVRARALFERAGFEVLPAPADPLPRDTADPDERLSVLAWVGGEFVARLYYRLAGYL